MNSLLMILIIYSGFAFGSQCESYLEDSPSGKIDLESTWKAESSQFSKKQVKRWGEAMTHLLEDLKQVDESRPQQKDFQVKKEWEKALKALPTLVRAWKNLELNAAKKHYFKEVYAGVWATLLMHSHEMIDAKKSDNDFGRYFKILKEIQDFNSNNVEFSLYRIRRAIEGKYSLKEFNNCL